MKQVIVLFLLAAGFSANAQNVQQAQCLAPRGKPNAPVGVIYLHGWFPRGGNNNYIQLERNNREKLQDLANRLGVRVAIPVSGKIHSNGNRTWTGTRLDSIENMSTSACGGAALAVPRRLIGFSDGGYAARRIGLNCEAKRAQYSHVIMTGARPLLGGVGGAACAPFYFTGGRSDGTTNMGAAKAMMRILSGRGRTAQVLPAYPGRHVIPTGATMAEMMGNPDRLTEQLAEGLPVISTGAPVQPPAHVVPGFSAGFIQ